MLAGEVVVVLAELLVLEVAVLEHLEEIQME